MSYRVIFFGTPAFAATILSTLLEKKVEVLAVVTKPDRPQKRSKELIFSPVKNLALEKNLPVLQPLKASHPEFVEVLGAYDADLFLVAAYSEIFKDSLLALPKLGCINVHASILPKYRGASPIHAAILNGEKESGVTIMQMSAKLDGGKIYKIAKSEILPDMTTGELTNVLAEVGAKALFEVLEEMRKGTLNPYSQVEAEANYAPKVTPEDGFIDWDRECNEIYNRIRAMTPKPGAWCWVWIKGDKKKFLIKKARKVLGAFAPGMIFQTKEYPLIIGCHSGGIAILQLQLESKKEMSARDFLLGTHVENLKF